MFENAEYVIHAIVILAQIDALAINVYVFVLELMRLFFLAVLLAGLLQVVSCECCSTN